MAGRTRQTRQRAPVRRTRRPAAKGPTRQQIMRRRLIAGGSIAAVLLVSFVLLFTSTFDVKSVEVSGTKRLEKSAVEKSAGVAAEQSMFGVDPEVVERRVARLPEVGRVVVSRSWPSTLTVEVHERKAVAYFAAHDGVRLVDDHAVPFAKVDKQPPKLPKLLVRKVAANDPSARAALNVLGVVDEKLRKRVEAVKARTPGSVELRLRKGKVVRWGDAHQADRKTEVLDALMTRPGKVYDVSSPELPTVK